MRGARRHTCAGDVRRSDGVSPLLETKAMAEGLFQLPLLISFATGTTAVAT